MSMLVTLKNQNRLSTQAVKKANLLVQESQAAYTGKIEAKGTQETGKEGESLVQEPQAAYTGKVEAKALRRLVKRANP